MEPDELEKKDIIPALAELFKSNKNLFFNLFGKKTI